METDQMPAVTNDENTTTESALSGKSSRRDLVTKGAVAAAVAAVATGALTNRVHAANGDPMHVGESDSGTATTSITGGSTFQVVGGTSSQNASINGHVSGASSSLYGVRGFNSGSLGTGAGAGVYGKMSGSAQKPGTGVYGEHTGTGAGNGVSGMSVAGYGVRGNGAKADFLASGSGKIYISKASTPGPSANGSVGMIARDAAGALWYCYATNKWRELAGATSSGAFHAIAPKRVYDSRTGKAPLSVTKGKLNPGSNRVVDCTIDAPEVPSTATAVVLNLTAAVHTGTGNLAVYPDGSAAPSTSSINYTPGVNIANSTTSGCGPGAKVRVQCGATSAVGTEFIIDIVGYYV
jgi:hypothetical protein